MKESNIIEFQQLGVREIFVKALKKEKIQIPTPIQESVFQKIIDGENLIAQSKTGSGKTLAYLLPLFEKLTPVEQGNKIVILVPTHELAMQVQRQVKTLAENTGLGIHGVPIVGSVNIVRQIEALKKKPQIIIGTTGRILELMQMKKIAAHLIKTIVVDEADKMLAKNQVEETRAVIKRCMKDTQKLFFSASIGKEAIQEAKEISKDLILVRIDSKPTIPKNITHLYVMCEKREKLDVLRSLISCLKPQKAMVFINKAYDIEEATKKLQYHHYKAECIHGGAYKKDRKQVIQDFRKGKLNILIGTDIAARGLHFEDVDVVIHYSIPEKPKDYLHRSGRTGRGGKSGISISIVTKRELEFLKRYRKEFDIQILAKKLYNGKLCDSDK